MTIDIAQQPKAYSLIQKDTQELNFGMASDIYTCSLLRTLASSKPSGRFLELGTGTGLATSWILDGMDSTSQLISVDNDSTLLAVAKKFLGEDHRLTLTESDGAAWFEQSNTLKFDFIFADTWHGKYLLLDQALDMLNPGGLYLIDDMLPQPNWPEGHDAKALKLIDELEKRGDLNVTKLHWSTGLVICVKK